MLLCLEGRKGPLTCGNAIWGPQNRHGDIADSYSVIAVLAESDGSQAWWSCICPRQGHVFGSMPTVPMGDNVRFSRTTLSCLSTPIIVLCEPTGVAPGGASPRLSSITIISCCFV